MVVMVVMILILIMIIISDSSNIHILRNYFMSRDLFNVYSDI
jgi:hypothetical protein